MARTSQQTTWQSVRDEVLRRIQSRDWKPGEPIPHEADLAREFGCARATMNRALRDIADSGLIERRRRAGSRVALHPVRKATLDIPVIRIEIEARGETHAYRLIECALEAPPPQVAARLNAASGQAMLHVVGLHMADGKPYAFEDRWINPESVPEALTADFTRISPNEWLVLNVPVEGGDITFAATEATAAEARALECRPGAALFVTKRTTWRGEARLTTVRQLFAPGYGMKTLI
ncbi:GntR family transcriptional regulator [Marimonas lutisalis]|uniref:GntR family transcriptional regulator n=1 Tax=Marimonas lutisalis TaxID=2545756 RepID=UPI0010F43953|nr:GntR family transcriptional regulator [Marimonas lutisalis]